MNGSKFAIHGMARSRFDGVLGRCRGDANSCEKQVANALEQTSGDSILNSMMARDVNSYIRALLLAVLL